MNVSISPSPPLVDVGIYLTKQAVSSLTRTHTYTAAHTDMHLTVFPGAMFVTHDYSTELGDHVVVGEVSANDVNYVHYKPQSREANSKKCLESEWKRQDTGHVIRINKRDLESKTTFFRCLEPGGKLPALVQEFVEKDIMDAGEKWSDI